MTTVAPAPPRRIARLALDAIVTMHAVAVFAFVEITIRWVRLDTLARLLGCPLAFGAAAAEPGQPPQLRGRAVRRLRCVRRVARRWWLAQGPCLRTALVAGHLLRSHDPTIRLGSTGDGEHLSAHAWLELGGRPLQPVDRYRAFVGHDQLVT